MRATPTTAIAPASRLILPFASALALAVAACSPPAQEGIDDTTTSEAAAEAPAADAGAARAPDATSSAVAGVAFAYRFNFELADDDVSRAQDRHVAACERLGAARCRVTGVSYDQERDGPVTAGLTFLLDPALARGFTRDAVDSVGDLGGRLLDSSVGGEDVGSGIAASQAASATMGGDVARLEARLRQPGLGADERRDIAAQIETLRARLREEEGVRRGGEARLASTPVEFSYRGTTGIAGFDSSRPFASALAASADSFGSAAAFVLMLAGLLLPWALMAGGVVLALRWLRGRWARPAAAAAAD